MNGYTLTKRWYEYKFENINKVRSVHSDLFFYIVYLWNELGQVEKFGLPTSFTMQALGIGSYTTYKKALEDLVIFGFVIIVTEAKNQHQSKVIALANSDEATSEATIKPLKRAVGNTTVKTTDGIERISNIKYIKEQKGGKFTPPEFYQVQEMISSKGLTNVDPERFFNHYESNGWMIGKVKMKNWEAALKKWGASEKKTNINNFKNNQNGNEHEPRANNQTLSSAAKNAKGFNY